MGIIGQRLGRMQKNGEVNQWRAGDEGEPRAEVVELHSAVYNPQRRKGGTGGGLPCSDAGIGDLGGGLP